MTRTIQDKPGPQIAGASLTPPRSNVFREWFMKPNRSPLCCAVLLVSLVLFASFPALAQYSEQPTEGTNSGNYNVKQTVEFGGRIIPSGDFKDSRGTRTLYDTFVNLRSGPRLLDYTLEMRSLNHQGWLFDNLYLSNFGYGGDPNNVSRVRMYKNKWYNFSGTFRRDYTYWDYNLLANPLNPNTPVANAPAGFSPIILFSPHSQGLVRRMSDYNLTFLPQSRMRLRLAYNRNVQEGPSLTTFHEGTDPLFFQNWKTTVNSYQIGVDFKLLPRTNISYDQFLNYYKGDTTWTDENQTFALANGTLVDLGVPFNTAGSQPCATPFLAPPASRGTVNPACNGYLAYTRQGRIRTRFPTEQITFQSNYFKALDVSGRLAYSSSDYTVPDFNETMDALVTRTRQRLRTETGPASGRRVSVSSDFGATWYVTDKFRVVDMFRWNHFRLPAQWAFNECFFFGTSLAAPATFFPATAPLPTACAPPLSAVSGTPAHNASSTPDISVGLSSLFFKQDLKNNLFELEYDFTRRFGARLGYRFRHRIFFESNFESGTFVFFPNLQNSRTLPAPFNVDENGNPVFCPKANNRADGSCLITPEPAFDSKPTEVNEHSAVFGIWARPTDALRLSFDLELMSADNSFNRISPRQLQHYKARATYKPMSWASFGATVNILENRNNVFQVNNKQHNRIYGFSAAFEPNDRFSFDIGYDYNDVFSTSLICYPVGPAPTPAPPLCVDATNTPVPGLFANASFYANKAHYGYFDLAWRPVKRLRTYIGYYLTSTAGSTLIISGPQGAAGVIPNPPTGPLAYNFHKPYAGFAVDLFKGMTWRAQWNYYGYNEKESLLPVVDFTGARDFRGNMVTLAVRYAF